jgi:hypothetical protein
MDTRLIQFKGLPESLFCFARLSKAVEDPSLKLLNPVSVEAHSQGLFDCLYSRI